MMHRLLWTASRLLVLAAVFSFVGCSSQLDRTVGGCRTDGDCARAETCVAGACVMDGSSMGVDAGSTTSFDAPSTSTEDGGTGLLPPVGPPPVGGDDTWRPSMSVRLDCPWTSQRLASCSALHYCAPTSYLMGLACIEHRSLAPSQSAELLAAVDVLSSGAVAGYSAIGRCGRDMDFNVVRALATRSGYETLVGTAGRLDAIYEQLQAGRPVMVAVVVQPQNGSEEMTTAGANHAMLVTGLDAERIYLNDPLPLASTALGLRKNRPFTIPSFLRVWTERGYRAWLSFSGAASTCSDECPADRATTCLTTTTFRVCGNFDTDPCLEYGTVTPCPVGQTCGAAGCSGIACTEGVTCDNGNPCEITRIQCSSGRPVCVRQAFAAMGTPCPGGACNGAGTCSCPTSCPSPSSVACGMSLGSACGMACTGTGTMCPSGQICSGSTCRCPISCPAPSSVPCGSPLGSVCGMGCSGTGTMCSSGRVCSGGTCICPTSCPSPSTIACGVSLGSACGLACSGTGTQCPSGQLCSSGRCTCTTLCPSASSVPCGSSLGSACGIPCVGSGTMCSSGRVCRSGTCVSTTCPAPQIVSPISSDTNRYFARQGDIIPLSMNRSVGCEAMPHQGHIAQVDCGNVYGPGATPLSGDIAGTTWSIDTRGMSPGTCWRFTFSVYDPIERAAPFGVIQMDPSISYSPSSGAVGTTFTESGTGFTTNGAVDLRWRYPDGHYEPPGGPQRVTATPSGSWSLVWTSPPTALRGTYTATASDVTTRRTTTTTFTIR